MTTKQVENLIRQGENITIEFNKAANGLPKSMFETMCAFHSPVKFLVNSPVNGDCTKLHCK